MVAFGLKFVPVLGQYFVFMHATRFPFLLWYLSTFALIGCSSVESPELKELQNFKVVQSNRNIMQIEAEALFFNPNHYDLKLISSNLSISVNKKLLAVVKQKERIKIQRESNFKIPLQATISVDSFTDLALKNMESIFSGKLMQIDMTGELRINRFGFKQTIPVEYSLEVSSDFFSPF